MQVGTLNVDVSVKLPGEARPSPECGQSTDGELC
jgi:hypothetical protein